MCSPILTAAVSPNSTRTMSSQSMTSSSLPSPSYIHLSSSTIVTDDNKFLQSSIPLPIIQPLSVSECLTTTAATTTASTTDNVQESNLHRLKGTHWWDQPEEKLFC